MAFRGGPFRACATMLAMTEPPEFTLEELTGRARTHLTELPDLRWSLWLALAATGHADAADLDGELTRDDTGSGRTAHLRALAARPAADVKATAWTAILTDRSLSNEHLDATIAGFRAGGRRDLTARYDTDYFAVIRGVWDERSIEIARRIVVGLFPDSDTVALADGWLDAHPDAPGALRRLVLEQRDHLARDLRAQRTGGFRALAARETRERGGDEEQTDDAARGWGLGLHRSVSGNDTNGCNGYRIEPRQTL